MESMVETQASSLLQFIHGLRGELHVTWEESTWAAWLHDLLKHHVHEVLVCSPRRNAFQFVDRDDGLRIFFGPAEAESRNR
jgi:hypothetical protein